MIHLTLGRLIEGIQLLIVQAGVEALGLVVVHGPAHHAGGILVVVHPLEDGGLVVQAAVPVGEGGGLQLLDVAQEAGLVHLGLDEGGDLLVEGGAGADGQGKLHGLGVAGVGQHLLGGVGVILGDLQLAVEPLALGLGDDSGHRRAVLAGDGAGQLRLVQGIVEGLADLHVVKGSLGGVDGQVVDLGGGEDVQRQRVVGLHALGQGEGEGGGHVDLAGLELHQAGVVIRHQDVLDLLGLGHALLAVIGIGLQGQAAALHPLLEHVGAGADGVAQVLLVAHGFGIGLVAQHHVEAAQLGQEGGVGLLQGNDHLLVGGLNRVNGLGDVAVVGGLIVPGAVEGPDPVAGLHVLAVGELDPLHQVEGVGQAVVADGPVGGQLGLDGAVVAGEHQALEDLLGHLDLGGAHAGGVGLDVLGLGRDAHHDLVGVAGLPAGGAGGVRAGGIAAGGVPAAAGGQPEAQRGGKRQGRQFPCVCFHACSSLSFGNLPNYSVYCSKIN